MFIKITSIENQRNNSAHAVSIDPESLTFWIVFQQEVEMAQLAENVRVHFPLCFENERIIAANSLDESSAQLERHYNTAVKLNSW